MALTGYYKTLVRPRTHRPLSMLKYDPVGTFISFWLFLFVLRDFAPLRTGRIEGVVCIGFLLRNGGTVERGRKRRCKGRYRERYGVCTRRKIRWAKGRTARIERARETDLRLRTETARAEIDGAMDTCKHRAIANIDNAANLTRGVMN